MQVFGDGDGDANLVRIAGVMVVGGGIAGMTAALSAAGAGGMGMIGGIIYLAVIILMLASFWRVFTKAGQPGLAEDTPLWGVPFNIMVSKSMPDHVAYKLVETWWTNYKEYGPIHSVLREWTPETFTNPSLVVPYHTAAIQFYKEKGVWTPEMEKAQNQALKE